MKKATVPFKRKRFLIVFSAVVIIAATSLAVFLSSPKQLYLRNKAEFNAAAEEILEKQDTQEIKITGVSDITYHEGKSPIVEFITGGYGLVPSAAYKGIYYSSDGSPAPFQNANVKLTKTQDGWIWTGEGDNKGKTEHIEGNWYTFEVHF